MKLKIKKGDTVEVIAGADKGKKGAVIEIVAAKMKIRVQGARVQTHFDKKEGVLKKEGLLDYSNVKLVEKATAAAKTKKTAKKSASKSK
jgi:large subunit ribosomal protein L24